MKALEEHLEDLREDLTQQQEEKHKKALDEFLYDIFGPERKVSKDSTAKIYSLHSNRLMIFRREQRYTEPATNAGKL